MTESDWKLFRELRVVALDRFCLRVLSEISRIAEDGDKTGHERYLAVFKRLKERDRELADAFDDPRRSTALRQLVCLRSQALLTEEEFAQFSAETRGSVETWLA